MKTVFMVHICWCGINYVTEKGQYALSAFLVIEVSPITIVYQLLKRLYTIISFTGILFIITFERCCFVIFDISDVA